MPETDNGICLTYSGPYIIHRSVLEVRENYSDRKLREEFYVFSERESARCGNCKYSHESIFLVVNGEFGGILIDMFYLDESHFRGKYKKMSR